MQRGCKAQSPSVHIAALWLREGFGLPPVKPWRVQLGDIATLAWRLGHVPLCAGCFIPALLQLGHLRNRRAQDETGQKWSDELTQPPATVRLAMHPKPLSFFFQVHEIQLKDCGYCWGCFAACP